VVHYDELVSVVDPGICHLVADDFVADLLGVEEVGVQSVHDLP
jgi:hypothetical protein